MEMVAKHLESFPVQEQSAARQHTAIQIKNDNLLSDGSVSFFKRITCTFNELLTGASPTDGCDIREETPPSSPSSSYR